MNAEKLTQKSIETINRAQQIACEKRHSMVTQLHLAYALLDEANDLNRQLFTAIGVDAAAMLKDIDSELNKQAVLGSGEAGKYMTSELQAALDQAESESKRMGDSYVSEAARRDVGIDQWADACAENESGKEATK